MCCDAVPIPRLFIVLEDGYKQITRKDKSSFNLEMIKKHLQIAKEAFVDDLPPELLAQLPEIPLVEETPSEEATLINKKQRRHGKNKRDQK